MKVCYFLPLIILFSGCQKDFKKCNTYSGDETLNLYSDVLNELVVKQFYNHYLGKDEEMIFKAWNKKHPDTAKIMQRIIRLHNQLFNDTTKFCGLVMDTFLRKRYSPLSYLDKDSLGRLLKQKFLSYSTNGQEVIDSLNTLQKKYKPSDFHLCTAKLISIMEISHYSHLCSIGRIQLSKVMLNQKKNKGILYCNFICGELCGKGVLLEVSKSNTGWKIDKRYINWSS